MPAPKFGSYDEGMFWFTRNGRTLTLGLSEEVVETLGEVLDLQLPSEGDDFVKGDVVATVVGHNKTVELTAPAAGLVTSVNAELQSRPELVTEDAGEEGWIAQIEIQDPTDLEEYA